MNKQEFRKQAQNQINDFIMAAFELGLSVETTQRLIKSKQGIKFLNDRIMKSRLD